MCHLIRQSPLSLPFIPGIFLLLTSLLSADEPQILNLLSFNILQGGGNAANVGFPDQQFDGSRLDEIAAVIHFTKADLVGIQEDANQDRLLLQLGDGWFKGGSVYSRFPLSVISHERYLTVVRVHLPNRTSVVVANCHWAPSRYGPFHAQELLLQQGSPSDADAFAEQVLTYAGKPQGARGYHRTMKALQPLLNAGETLFLTGDFNEPSHLDWTARYQQQGRSRWPGAPADRPLRQQVAWPGSMRLEQAGMQDAYRVVKPDEVKFPGITWTPQYPAGTPGRREYSAQVLDRIDMIYFRSDRFHPRQASVVGEGSEFTELIWPGHWPSDHRAVLVQFVSK